METNKTFYAESYDLICGLIEYISRISTELSNICDENYLDKFRTSRETINRLTASITKFVDKWGSDEDGICKSLKTIREYYGYYCVTLNNSSPSMCNRDSKYIIDSINTTKLALTCKLKKIKEKL
jgi:hypothetical protein